MFPWKYIHVLSEVHITPMPNLYFFVFLLTGEAEDMALPKKPTHVDTDVQTAPHVDTALPEIPEPADTTLPETPAPADTALPETSAPADSGLSREPTDMASKHYLLQEFTNMFLPKKPKEVCNMYILKEATDRSLAEEVHNTACPKKATNTDLPIEVNDLSLSEKSVGTAEKVLKSCSMSEKAKCTIIIEEQSNRKTYRLEKEKNATDKTNHSDKTNSKQLKKMSIRKRAILCPESENSDSSDRECDSDRPLAPARKRIRLVSDSDDNIPPTDMDTDHSEVFPMLNPKKRKLSVLDSMFQNQIVPMVRET